METRRKNVTDDLLAITVSSTRSKTSVNGIDLIFEIFLRLPAKSIAICRCVWKLWASILRRPDFRELFLTKSYARPQLLISCVRKGDLFLFSSSQVQNPNENSSVVATNHHKKFPVRDLGEIHSHAHGLVCLTVAKGWEGTVPVICNPSTGQSFPLSGLKTLGKWVTGLIGYDPIDKQYKVLSFTSPRHRTYVISEKPEVLTSEKPKVLTLGTKKLSWRTVECFTHLPTSHGISINGLLYYNALVDGLRGGYKIACFDVRSEKCRIINLDQRMEYWYDSTLVNYEGKLGVLLTDELDTFTKETTCFKLWVLVNAEKHEWSKHVYALPDSWKDVIGDAKSYSEREPCKLHFVGMTVTNEVVLSPRFLSNPFYVFYYNLERKTVKKVEIQGMDACKDFIVHIFLNHVEDVKLMQRF